MLAGAGGVSPSILKYRRMFPRMLDALRSDLSLLDGYTYHRDTALPCPITAFGGMRDPMVSLDDLEPWCDETSGSFRLEVVDGDHFFVEKQPKAILEILSKAVEESCSGGAGEGPARGEPF